MSEAFDESQNGHHEQVKGLFTRKSIRYLINSNRLSKKIRVKLLKGK